MSKLLAFLSLHRVKLLGGAITLLGFIQSYPGLPKLMTPAHFAALMVVLGAASAVFGFLRKQPGNFFNSWKTVIVGTLTTVISFFQAVPNLPSLVPGMYEQVAFALGLATVFIGIINTMQANQNGGSSP